VNLLAAIFLEAAWRDFCVMFGLDPASREARWRAREALKMHVAIRGVQFGGGG
jgi:hypothetical protein